jgi:hypothetical protein
MSVRPAEILRPAHHCWIGEAAADCFGLVKRNECSVELASEQLLQRVHAQDQAPFGTVRSALDQHAAGSRPPAACLSQLARKDHAVADPVCELHFSGDVFSSHGLEIHARE